MNKFDTPILFLVFNRLETTKKVFQKIREVQPRQLFIAADGPRENYDNEKNKCAQVRNYILENIDWDCEIKTLFRNKNLGCGRAVSEAITWFFQGTEQGIILEDDCLPNNSFFQFCEEMLNKYKDEEMLHIVSGFSPYPRKITKKWGDYGFVKIPHIWGWGTWKRAWDKYDFSIISYTNNEIDDKLKEVFPQKEYQNYWNQIFKDVYANKVDTWDFQLTYAIFKNKTLCVNPAVSLVSNIGIGGGTHTLTKRHPLSKTKNNNLSFPITTLSKMESDKEAQEYDMGHNFMKYYLIKKYLKRLKLFNLARSIYNRI